MFLIMFIEICCIKYYCVCVVISNINVFHFIITFFKNLSDMWETKTVLVLLSIILLEAASFCICQVHAENKVGHYGEVKIQNACENEYKKYCFNGAECYYLVVEDFLGYNCSWLYGGKRFQKYMWWELVRNWYYKRWKYFTSKSDKL